MPCCGLQWLPPLWKIFNPIHMMALANLWVTGPIRKVSGHCAEKHLHYLHFINHDKAKVKWWWTSLVSMDKQAGKEGWLLRVKRKFFHWLLVTRQCHLLHRIGLSKRIGRQISIQWVPISSDVVCHHDTNGENLRWAETPETSEQIGRATLLVQHFKVSSTREYASTKNTENYKVLQYLYSTSRWMYTMYIKMWNGKPRRVQLVPITTCSPR